MTQQIRPSQFITTYGPGSILESLNGPRIIPNADIGLYNLWFKISDYRINDQRMSKGLLHGASIYRLPSNAETGQNQTKPLYFTKSFPSWKLCLNWSNHHGNYYVLTENSVCPVCKVKPPKSMEAIRFIVACSDGHMDDFDWNYFVHGNSSSCNNVDWFKWYGGGGSLSKIYVECPSCNRRSINMGEAYKQKWRCSGRFPEREPLDSAPQKLGGCNRGASIIQRQASNLRIPELRTLFSIPPHTTVLHNQLSIPEIKGAIIAKTPKNSEELQQTLGKLKDENCISANTLADILYNPWSDIKMAISELYSNEAITSYRDLILEEFHRLEEASINGAPPVRGQYPKSRPVFQVDPNLIKLFNGPGGHSLRVTPIETLRTVVVQYGYRREVDSSIKARARIIPVDSPDLQDPYKKWFPGVEFFGEGIFIRLDDPGSMSPFKGEASTEWNKAAASAGVYNSVLFRDPNHQDELDPHFVWWHTLSHLLIRAISTEAGYSSASIRERVYFEADKTLTRGGILLYATQPGNEGTLGGLIALVPYFQDILDTAFRNLSTCSTDPLCIEHRFKLGEYNGAACYGCLLTSETSCEHRNMYLDRNLLLENLP
jgi:hypothetical protein